MKDLFRQTTRRLEKAEFDAMMETKALGQKIAESLGEAVLERVPVLYELLGNTIMWAVHSITGEPLTQSRAVLDFDHTYKVDMSISVASDKIVQILNEFGNDSRSSQIAIKNLESVLREIEAIPV